MLVASDIVLDVLQKLVGTAINFQNEKEMARFYLRLDRIKQRSDFVYVWIPVFLDTTRTLIYRLAKILSQVNKEYPSEIEPYSSNFDNYACSKFPDWSMTHEYALYTTAYLIAKFFGWNSVIRHECLISYFLDESEKDFLDDSYFYLSESLGNYYRNLDDLELTGYDRQVYREQTMTIGSLMIRKVDGQYQCLSYPEFLTLIKNEEEHFAPLFELLRDIDYTQQSKRYRRLMDFTFKLSWYDADVYFLSEIIKKRMDSKDTLEISDEEKVLLQNYVAERNKERIAYSINKSDGTRPLLPYDKNILTIDIARRNRRTFAKEKLDILFL